MKYTPPQLSEQEIVSLLTAKDIRGIEALYDQYSAFIYGLIREIVKFEDLAEIVLQDTFLKVWDKIDSYSSRKGRFLTWLMNIARNRAIDMIRSKNYKQTLKLISLENIPANKMSSTYSLRIESIGIKDIVSRLESKYKEPIELIYFQGYTQKEASRELGIPLGTVKSRVQRAFKDLKVLLVD